MFERLRAEAETLGRSAWRPMLRYVAELHARSVLPPAPPFALPWEHIGPGYVYGPAFGHWDLVHQLLDSVPVEPAHVRDQLRNLLGLVQADGYLPPLTRIRDGRPLPPSGFACPPVWPVAVQALAEQTGSLEPVREALPALERHLAWFEAHRAVPGGGFYYVDMLTRRWESGIDEGVRFDDPPPEPQACVDATAHLYWAYEHAAQWREAVGAPDDRAATYRARAGALRALIQEDMFDPQTGFFHDVWAARRPGRRRLAHEGMWPVVAGAATAPQAQRVIDENLLHPRRFFAAHPITTVGVEDPAFELRMWRGPAWNSMTYWAARGCLRYGRPDAARRLLAAALDGAARQFARTGTIWEFYHPHGGRPEDVQRKPQTPFNRPCRDYLGHNPLLAMARLWQAAGG
jgi:putative isomerase